MKELTSFIKSIKTIDKAGLRFASIALVSLVCIAVFMHFYFGAYVRPYMMGEVIPLTEGWTYRTEHTDINELATIRSGPMLLSGETLTLYRRLDIKMDEAVILIRANHQAINVFLDDVPLFMREVQPGQNPGMALHFITLPHDYYGRTLKIESTSPYAIYSGRTGTIFMGSHVSLQAFTLSASMRSLIFMAMCLLMGLVIVAITFVQAMKGFVYKQNLAIGVFAIIWAFYYVCTDFIVFQFFSPVMVSNLSLGLYFSFQAPLSLFFYFSMKKFRKWMLPAVILHCGFPMAAIFMQLVGILDLPQVLHINNALLIGLAYTIVLVVLDASKGNKIMWLYLFFFAISYFTLIYDFNIFYRRLDEVAYNLRDTNFVLILCVLIYNLYVFFHSFYRQMREGEVLTLQSRLAKDSYESIKSHLHQVGALKHEMGKHLAAMQTYMKDERYADAKKYLEQFGARAEIVTQAVHHNNFLINAVIQNLLYTANEHRIKVELKLQAEPKGISDPDLYSLLNNILDNALEASDYVANERFIRLSVFRREPYFVISCTNSCTGEIIKVSEEERLQTTKQEEGHGYGLWIVEQIAYTYDGLVDTDFKDGMFNIKVALKDN